MKFTVMNNLTKTLAIGSLFFWTIATVPVSQATADACQDESRYPHVSMSELKQAIAARATIVDVNSKASFEKVHVTGAVHFGTHKDDLAKVLPQDKAALVVAYCGGPECTAWKKAAIKACELGYTNVRHFSGGLKAWMKAQSRG